MTKGECANEDKSCHAAPLRHVGVIVGVGFGFHDIVRVRRLEHDDLDALQL